MADYTAATYGDHIAEIYDELHPFTDETGPAVDTLAALADGGPVLELAIGTGRLALPLAARGLAVTGIDASQAMVDKLRAKPGGADIPVTMGDFADVGVDGPFRLAFVAFNTLFAVLTQDDQIRCFANVARRLAAGGRFVVEGFVPDVARFDRGQRTSTTAVDPEMVRFDAMLHDPATQTITGAHVILTEQGTRILPVQVRYCWPSELDLMARLAGLELEFRWADWKRAPFTASSGGHVSVYRAA